MTKTLSTVLLASIVLLFGTVFFLTRSTPQIIVLPELAMVDEPVEITITNLAPQEKITLEASCSDNAMKSSAVFQANEKGMVDVAHQAPMSGSYRGIDGMGLFWSMVPISMEVWKEFWTKVRVLSNDPIVLSVYSVGKLKAQKTMHRLQVSPNVEKREIRQDGVVGTLFYPRQIQHGPGVIVLGGSGGGIPEDFAKLIASHGYTTLALGYFRAPGLPKVLKNIPLEYFQNAMQWFKKQPEVDANHIALCGRSRGGELVLLLAATFPGQMQGVIAYVPSGLVWGADDWTYNNMPVRGVERPSKQEEVEAAKRGLIKSNKGTFEDPIDYTPVHAYCVKRCKNIEQAIIPVEKIQCPLLLISAQDDKVWPSALLSNMVMRRLDEKKSTITRKHLAFSAAGHAVLNPYLSSPGLPFIHPVEQKWLAVGGTSEGNARANKQAWAEVLDFLKKTLGK